MKITRLRITSYRGIAELDTKIAPSGAVVRGRNGAGKTSVLRALKAALAAQDISADAIKHGADKSEILVDLDDLSVKRVITSRGSTLSVEKAGLKASKPQTYLTELLGASALDPLDFFLAKKSERKAMVLAALPITVTREQIEKYVPDTVSDLPLNFSAEGHGLDVLDRAHKFYYEERAAAKKEAVAARREADRLAEEARKLSSVITPGPIVPEDEARAAFANAERTLLGLESRASEVQKANERTEVQRGQIVRLRADADAIEPPPPADLSAVIAAEYDAQTLVSDLEQQLAEAREALHFAQEATTRAKATNARRDREFAHAAQLREQANAIESALAAATVQAPTAEELTQARTAVVTASNTVRRAQQQAEASTAVETADKATTAAATLEEEVADLEEVVKRLARDAQNELLATANGIPGLTIEGDEVLLDGKRVDALCGAEQLRFAVEIARRANSKTKLLLVDGLERLDPEQMDVFIAEATRGGYQLLATKVDRGAVVIDAISADETAAAAE